MFIAHPLSNTLPRSRNDIVSGKEPCPPPNPGQCWEAWPHPWLSPPVLWEDFVGRAQKEVLGVWVRGSDWGAGGVPVSSQPQEVKARARLCAWGFLVWLPHGNLKLPCFSTCSPQRSLGFQRFLKNSRSYSFLEEKSPLCAATKWLFVQLQVPRLPSWVFTPTGEPTSLHLGKGNASEQENVTLQGAHLKHMEGLRPAPISLP